MKSTLTTPTSTRPLAVITGASSGIGFDLVIAADQGPLQTAYATLSELGASVSAVQTDLARSEGIDDLMAAVGTRNVDALLANAGHGLGHGFLEQDFVAIEHVINTNITGTLDLIHRIDRNMRERGSGCILITGSFTYLLAGFMPGTYQAVYNGSKSFIDSFAYALREELKDSGVSVTVLMPGVTDTDFFARADLMDTKIGTDKHKANPADVAKLGFDAMMEGKSDVIAGFKNKVQAVLANITPAEVLAKQHRKMAAPGSARG